MHRFYLPEAQSAGRSLTLTGAEAHHALHVLRIRRGEEIVILDGKGSEFLCRVQETSRDSVGATVVESKQHPVRSCRITLLQAVPKGKLIETIIQKATELGASRIIPLITERTVVQLDEKEGELKASKWQAIAVEAIKQSGSPFLPEVLAPQSPAKFLARKEHFDLPLVGSLEPGNKHPRHYFEAFRAAHHRDPVSACVWIGPEGDFTAEEYREIAAGGALPITLGPLVLRTDTAASYCLSVLSYELSAILNQNPESSS